MHTKNGGEVPMGFGMALLSNPRAYVRFAQLSDAEQQSVIQGTHGVQSKEEMAEYVQRLTD